MKILKKKITRISAFLLACILMGISTFTVVDVFISKAEILDYGLSDYVYHAPTGNRYLRENVSNFFDTLWLIGNMYLRNVDENGKYTCTEEKKRSIIEVLTERGLMDSNGRIKIDDMGDFDYYVSYGDKKISSTDVSFDELCESAYSFIYSGANVNDFDRYNVLYTTNYGVERYLINYYDEIVLYDYDTAGLDYCVDRYGNEIYYKTDGSTPVISDNYEDSCWMYDGGIYGESPDYIYEAEDNADFVPQQFRFNREDDSELKIIVQPSAAVMAEYEKRIDDYNAAKDRLIKTLGYVIPLAAAVLALTVFVFIADGWDDKENKYVLRKFDKIWTELLIAASAGMAVVIIGHFIPDIAVELKEMFGAVYVKALYTMTIPLLYGGIVLLLCSVLRKIKCRCFFKTAFVYKFIFLIFRIIKKIFRKIRNFWWKNIEAKQLVKDDILARKFLLRLGVCCFIEIFIIYIATFVLNPFSFVIFNIPLLTAYIILNLRDMKSVKNLNEQIESISQGDYTPVSVPEKSVTYHTVNRLNSISDGIQKAVDNRIKSERMKIDLVTNVSHDLKTPLTSIISYIDLLSKEELPPAASDYVKILEQKSERLKSIVSDLFDLAKATSSTDVKSEEIDAVILIGQVLADMSDKIQKYGREIRRDISADTAPISAEGKKMYRVFQNLLDNALKYSMEGTRIYLKLYTDQNEAAVEIKNTSAYEMKFTADEITERFVRGDESRSSEGNGLGLSIAKSFTETCGGKFAVSIDGDVFAAEVRFPLRELPE